MPAVDVSDLGAHESEPFQRERGKSDLHGPRVVETGVGLESTWRRWASGSSLWIP